MLQDRKAQIRRDVIAARDALDPAERAAASAVVRDRLAALEVVASAQTLLAFAAFGSEVDLDPLLEDRIAAGVGVFLPFVERFSPPTLEIARVRDLAGDLRPTRLGIREPDPQRRRSARVDRLDVVIAPGVAFDALGRRIGYGSGFYDRLLPRLRPGTPVIAAAFAVQIVAAVPEAAHDVRVDAVVTEGRTIGSPGGTRERG
ncbi:MAG TPA: 5-formyltetrahydrofolate cyclo-ligase [Euzebyales bacterium]|nr:5-formyltetrahydrofolate cyclo-ligase [Euzebyales bacterium]